MIKFRSPLNVGRVVRTFIWHVFLWLEQCIRRICLSGHYSITEKTSSISLNDSFTVAENAGETSTQQLLQHYCRFLYERHHSYEAVARITQMDRRTVRKYIVD